MTSRPPSDVFFGVVTLDLVELGKKLGTSDGKRPSGAVLYNSSQVKGRS